MLKRKQRRGPRLPTMERLLKDGYKQAHAEYPSLLGIYECIPRVYRMGASELIQAYCKGWTQQFWITDNDDYVDNAGADQNATLSAFACMLERGDERRTAIFLQTDPRKRPGLRAGMLYMLFVHELGHIDDMCKGINVRDADTVDMIAAEEYAHHFACRRIMEGAAHSELYRQDLDPSLFLELDRTLQSVHSTFLRLYLDEMLSRLAVSPIPSICEAAQRVIDSDDYPAYRRFGLAIQ